MLKRERASVAQVSFVRFGAGGSANTPLRIAGEIGLGGISTHTSANPQPNREAASEEPVQLLRKGEPSASTAGAMAVQADLSRSACWENTPGPNIWYFT